MTDEKALDFGNECITLVCSLLRGCEDGTRISLIKPITQNFRFVKESAVLYDVCNRKN